MYAWMVSISEIFLKLVSMYLGIIIPFPSSSFILDCIKISYISLACLVQCIFWVQSLYTHFQIFLFFLIIHKEVFRRISILSESIMCMKFILLVCKFHINLIHSFFIFIYKSWIYEKFISIRSTSSHVNDVSFF